MALLTREQFLVAGADKFVDVPCPELAGGLVRVKLMSGAERDSFEAAMADRQALGKLRENCRAVVTVYSAVDEQGARLFTEADLETLGKMPWTLLERIADAAAKLNKSPD